MSGTRIETRRGFAAMGAVLVTAVLSAGSSRGAGFSPGVLATWKNGEITASEFRTFLQNKTRGLRGAGELTEPERQQFIRAYVLLRELAGEPTPEWDARREALLHQAMVRATRAEAVEEAVGIPDSDLRAYYILHKKEFEAPESYFFRHIFLNTADLRFRAEAPGLPDDERLSAAELEREIEKKRERAREAWEKVQAGADFVGTAREYSESGGEEHPEERGIQLVAEVRDDGLYVGAGRLQGDMESQLRALEPGGISPLFETKHGFEIMKLEKYVPGGILPFEEVRERIARRLGRDARRTAKERVDSDILASFDVVERYSILEDPEAPPEAVVFSISGPEGEFDFTVGDYEKLVETFPPLVQEKFRSSAEARERHLRDNILLDQAAYFLAKRRGLDRDENLKKQVEAQLLEVMAQEEFDRRVEANSESVTEQELREEWEVPLTQKLFGLGEEVRLQAFAVGSLATPESSASARHFGLRYALRLAERISDRLREGEEYAAVADYYSVSATEETSNAARITLPGGAEALGLTDKPLGAEQVKALGDLGWLRREALLRFGLKSVEAAKAVMELATGEVVDSPVAYVTGPDSDFPGPDGYLVFQSLGRRTGGTRSFEEVRGDLEEMVRSRRLQKLRQEMYGSMLQEVQFELNRPVWEQVWKELER